MTTNRTPRSPAVGGVGAESEHVPVLPSVADKPPPIVRGEPVAIAEGVFVIPDNRVPLVPNVGIVVGDRAALIVDTGLGLRNGSYVFSQARRLAGGRPLHLVITHFDPGHAFGAQAFKGAATIIYNHAQRDELHAKSAVYVDLFRAMSPAIAAEFDGLELVEPDVIFDSGEAEIDLGGHTAVLRRWGPAHAIDDQTVLIDNRVLFTGDLSLTRMFAIALYFAPFDADLDADRWISVLDELLALKPEIVVPGHGEVGDTGVIRDIRDYLDHVRREAVRLRASGASAEEAAAEIDRDARVRWSTWDTTGWISFAARAFFHAGTPDGARAGVPKMRPARGN
jgi:glyoxylase-like metal-dependent hydrolase (beta-lactamase superfamily II)